MKKTRKVIYYNLHFASSALEQWMLVWICSLDKQQQIRDKTIYKYVNYINSKERKNLLWMIWEEITRDKGMSNPETFPNCEIY